MLKRFFFFTTVIFCLCLPFGAQGQQAREVKGAVVDARGEAVIGAAVMIKGTHTGTITGADGSFALNAPGDAVLVISSIGYKDAEEAVGGRSELRITLEEDTLLIEDAVESDRRRLGPHIRIHREPIQRQSR